MAVLAPRRYSVAATPSSPVHLPVASTGIRERLWNALPLTLSLFLVSTLFWAPFYAPQVFAVGMLIFFIYWVVRSYSVLAACVAGLFFIRSWKRTNWQAKYCAWLPQHPGAERWDWPRHMVIIPNYKESEEGLSRTLDSLAAQANADQLVVVMAMEAREDGSREKAAHLLMRYRLRFGEMFATFHPAGLPNETPGKGSNEAWAAREAHMRLIADAGDDLLRYTITSCDADAVFHPRHFEALNYLFLTARDRYRTFWQPAIFNSNNIWDIPAPLRIPDGLSGINRLSNLKMPGSVRFPTSCYSLSWQMLHEVDYWDEEVIPEDWHLYLKCSFTLGDRVNCQPVYLPLGNDCVLTDRYTKTLRAHYAQSVRHAWGASDIPYAWRSSMNRKSPLSMKRKLLLSGAVTKVHALWMAQWYLVTLGVLLPNYFASQHGAAMPNWWTDPRFDFRGLKLNPNAVFTGNWHDLAGTSLSLTLVGLIVYVCIVPLFGLIALEMGTRGPRPAYVSRKKAALQLLVWPCMAVITFFWASLPALHAQLKLASGKGLIYRVAEKGRRPVALPRTSAHNDASAEPYTAAGGK